MSPSSCSLVRRVSVLALLLCGTGCGPSKPAPVAAPAAAPAAAPVAIEPAPVAIEPAPEAAPELTAPESAAVRLEPLPRLLAREAIFWAESGAPCGDGRRAALVVPGSDRPSSFELAERAGCGESSGPVDAGRVQQICCPNSLEIPSREQTGGGAACASAVTEYLGMVQQSGAVPPAMAGLTMTIQQHTSWLSQRDYIAHCQLPAGMSVRICAAIRSGRAEGVTVITDPPSLGKADCVALAVRSRGFPPLPMPTLDLTRAEIPQVP